MSERRTAEEVARGIGEKSLDFDNKEDWIKMAALRITQYAEEQLGYEKQEWNKRCNEACEKQVLKQVNAAYDQCVEIADRYCPGNVCGYKIRALKTHLVK